MIKKTLSASDSASLALDYLQGKRSFSEVIAPPQLGITKKRKVKSIPIVVCLFVCFCSIFCFVFYDERYELRGAISVDGKFARSCEINFLDEDRKVETVYSDERGRFTISLKKGTYFIFLGQGFKNYSDHESTPFRVKVYRNIDNLRMFVVLDTKRH